MPRAAGRRRARGPNTTGSADLLAGVAQKIAESIGAKQSRHLRHGKEAKHGNERDDADRYRQEHWIFAAQPPQALGHRNRIGGPARLCE
jgi:hypothetical protein